MILRDPIHGLVAFESEEDAIVTRLLGTREVQRLRRIRQLGLTSLAYPGAEHTRFAHAIGAAHVMRLFLARLRQIDGDLPFWQRVTSERARDAIAAAFLHDVGHGPLAPVRGGAPRRLAPRAVVGAHPPRSLVRGAQDPRRRRLVLAPARGRSRPRQAPAPVPRQRRERDLRRRSLRLPAPRRPRDGRALRRLRSPLAPPQPALRRGRLGPSPTLAIDGAKGLAAIEAFLLARFFMFQQVYFHKSTRAAEWMIGAILRRAVAQVRDGVRLPTLPKAFATVAAGDTPSLDDYLELDDQVLLGAIHDWENASDPVLADLCKRLRARALQVDRALPGPPRRVRGRRGDRSRDGAGHRQGDRPERGPRSRRLRRPRRGVGHALPRRRVAHRRLLARPHPPPGRGLVPARSPAQRDDHARARHLRPGAPRSDARGADPLRAPAIALAAALAALTAAAPSRADENDGAYGRLDGDLELRVEAGAGFASGGPRSPSARRRSTSAPPASTRTTPTRSGRPAPTSPDRSPPASTSSRSSSRATPRTTSTGRRGSISSSTRSAWRSARSGARRAATGSRSSRASSSRRRSPSRCSRARTGRSSASAARCGCARTTRRPPSIAPASSR